MIPKLSKSEVVFCENPHGYRLGEKELSGVTSLIKNVLRLGVYPDADEYVQNVCIPRAGEYGTAVHHAIETYDTLGILVTSHPKSERFRKSEDDETWEVEEELNSYIRNQRGFLPVANEYTVSDNVRYASNIDNVWLNEETQGIWLVDTKTNNVQYYPGGEQGLREYLSWQLSIYAHLFEAQNPGLKVEGLACNWLRKGESAFWTIDRKTETDVEELLAVEWLHTDSGFIYLAGDLAPEPVTAIVKPVTDLEGVSREMIENVVQLTTTYNTVKELYESEKAKLRAALEKNGIKSWDAGVFKATIANDSETRTFDSTKFKKDHPDLYEQYTKTSVRKGGFTIKLRDK